MKNKKTLLTVALLVVIVAAMLIAYFATRPQTSVGAKTYTVTVVHANGTEKSFTYHTAEEYLGYALEAEGLIQSNGADDGMFHTVDGEKADWDINQSYWAFYEGEQYAMTGIYATPVSDGAQYKLVYTLG